MNGSGPAAPDGTGSAPELRGGAHGATAAACGALLALVVGLGSYGNLIVLLSCLDPALRRLRTDFDFMILNLSFCDLFLCGVAAPMFAFVLFSGPAHSVPGSLCFTFHLTSSGFILLSLKTVALIALHRLRVALGKRPPRAASVPCTLLLTLLLWASSFTLATVASLQPRRPGLCLPMAGLASREGEAVLYLYATDFLCCVAVVAVCYAVIARALSRNARARRGPPGEANGPRPFAVPALYRNQTRGLNLAAGKDARAVGTCVAIMVSVLVCCLPLGVSLVQDTLWGSNGFVLCQLELCGFTLVFFKSGLNPFIYSRNSAGLRRRVLWGLRCVAMGCCKHKTRLRAVGKGSLEVNRNKSSHHETNSAYVLTPKPHRKLMDQACGPSHSKESVLSPKASMGQQHYAQSSSTPMNTRVEPYYSIYNSSPSQEVSTPNSLQPVSSVFGFTRSYIAMHYRDCGGAVARHIPVPSV
ncbi:probable G-protein coupled receptor 75 [Melopsittacus undulatus]|uniref:Uncharacterized protein n=1 Tax=Melopsittacus undulatus TaxID=13146 RepID=A0A8V5G038_MELUD|nr:probable G-protein coupled receptor 75 [Melopsittacus undulatus]